MPFSELRERRLSAMFHAFDGRRDGVLTNDDPPIIIDRLAALGGLEPGSKGYTNLAKRFLASWKNFVMAADLDRGLARARVLLRRRPRSARQLVHGAVLTPDREPVTQSATRAS
jgi:hypothetical protein